jgi:hypothetical protein
MFMKVGFTFERESSERRAKPGDRDADRAAAARAGRCDEHPWDWRGGLGTIGCGRRACP